MIRARIYATVIVSRLVVVGVWCVVVVGCGACPQLKMTTGDIIPVVNRSNDTLHLFVNEAYPDTSVERAWYSSLVLPNERGGLGVLNRSWDSYLNEKGSVTVIFASSPRKDLSTRAAAGEQVVLGRVVLSKEVLDSLGGVIEFPPR
jgi:hypothetical protein